MKTCVPEASNKGRDKWLHITGTQVIICPCHWYLLLRWVCRVLWSPASPISQDRLCRRRIIHYTSINNGAAFHAKRHGIFSLWSDPEEAQLSCNMMTSSNENIFGVTGPLCGEFAGYRVNSPHKGQRRGALVFSLICARINAWVNNREAGDLRCHRAHYDVTIMKKRHDVPITDI